MSKAPSESPAAREQQERISESEVRAALSRNRGENRPGNPRDAERQDAGNERDLSLMTMSVEMLPREGRIFQKELEKSKKKSEVPHLIEAQKKAQAVIGAYMQGLKQDLRAEFTEEDFRLSSRAYGKGIQRRIEAMLDQAQREGLVTLCNGRVANRVGYAAPWIEELKKMRSGPDLTEKQKRAVMKIERFFQMVLEGDPAWAQVQRVMSQKRPDSLAVQRGKGALKMLGVLAIAGMALLSGLLDMKNKKISPYTLAWLGLAGWSVGFFKGQSETVRGQLAFTTTKEWENICKQLNIRGQDGVEFINDIQKKHKGKNRAKLWALLKKAQQQRTLNPKEYIPLLVGDNPQGPDAQLEAKLKTLSGSQLYALCLNVVSVTDKAANALIRDFVQHNVNSETVTPDLKQLQSPPSASTLSGTPPARPPQG